jgi:hypothetical protein
MYTTQGSTALKGAIMRSEGNQVWWSGAVPSTKKYITLMDEGIHDLIERGKDNATIQNIRSQNAILEEQLQAAKDEIAQRDAFRAQSQAYKKRRNQNWKKRVATYHRF